MNRKLATVFVLSLSLLAILGCPQRKSIAEVQRDPAHYMNNDVTIAGTVTRSFGALGTGVYEIDDGTGKIWVFAESTGVPSKGARVASTGRITPTISFAGQSYATVLRERVRHH